MSKFAKDNNLKNVIVFSGNLLTFGNTKPLIEQLIWDRELPYKRHLYGKPFSLKKA